MDDFISLRNRCKSDRTSKQFHAQLGNFLRDLIKQFPSEGDLVMASIYLENEVNDVDIILKFILRFLTYEKPIKERKENYLLSENILNNMIGDKYSYKIKTIWKHSDLTNKDKQVMWKWIDVFILFSKRYANENNIPFKGQNI